MDIITLIGILLLLIGLIIALSILNKRKDVDRSNWKVDVKFGDMFYSDYFKSNCVVVKSIGNEWYFCVEKGDYAGVIQRARSNPEIIAFISNPIKKGE